MSVELGKETVSEVHHSHRTVGTSAVRLTTLAFPLLKGLLMRAPGVADPVPNVGCVFVGGAGVTADTSASGGLPIPPGEILFLPIDDPSKVWVISTQAAQDIGWISM